MMINLLKIHVRRNLALYDSFKLLCYPFERHANQYQFKVSPVLGNSKTANIRRSTEPCTICIQTSGCAGR